MHRASHLFSSSSHLRTLRFRNAAFLCRSFCGTTPHRSVLRREWRPVMLRRYRWPGHQQVDTGPMTFPRVTESSHPWREDLLCSATELDEAPSISQKGAERDSEPGFFDKLSKLLGNIGMGRRNFWEGGVGAFVLAGMMAAFGVTTWVNGKQLHQGKPYTVIINCMSIVDSHSFTPSRSH